MMTKLTKHNTFESLKSSDIKITKNKNLKEQLIATLLGAAHAYIHWLKATFGT